MKVLYFGVRENVKMCDKSDIEMVETCQSRHNVSHSHSDLCQLHTENNTSHS